MTSGEERKVERGGREIERRGKKQGKKPAARSQGHPAVIVIEIAGLSTELPTITRRVITGYLHFSPHGESGKLRYRDTMPRHESHDEHMYTLPGFFLDTLTLVLILEFTVGHGVNESDQGYNRGCFLWVLLVVVPCFLTYLHLRGLSRRLQLNCPH